MSKVLYTTLHTDSVYEALSRPAVRTVKERHTLKKVVQLADTRRDTEVNGLVTEVYDDAAEDRGVNLALLQTVRNCCTTVKSIRIHTLLTTLRVLDL